MRSVTGLHVIIDGYNADAEKLDSMKKVFEFLDALPEKIGMTKLMSPIVMKAEGRTKEDRGYSGFVVIEESHISVHTWPEKRFLYADIFSCRPFDKDMAVAFTKEFFGIKSMEWGYAERGTKPIKGFVKEQGP